MPLLARTPGSAGQALERLRKRRVLPQQVHAHRQSVFVRDAVQHSFWASIGSQPHQVALFAGTQESIDKIVQLPDR